MNVDRGVFLRIPLRGWLMKNARGLATEQGMLSTSFIYLFMPAETYEFFLQKFKVAANFVRRTAGATRSEKASRGSSYC